MCDLSATDLELAVRGLVTAQVTNMGTEITLPVMYANGQSVAVVLSHNKGKCVVHDAGFGAMQLASFGGKMTKNVRKRLNDIAARFGCSFDQERVSRMCTVAQVASACVVVANVSKMIGDQALELRRHGENEFKAQLVLILKNTVGSRLKHNENVFGESGRSYRVDNVILDKNRLRPRAYIVGLHNRAVTSASFAELYDIKLADNDVATEVIYDSTSDIRPEDLRLLRKVSDPYPLDQARSRMLELIEA